MGRGGNQMTKKNSQRDLPPQKQTNKQNKINNNNNNKASEHNFFYRQMEIPDYFANEKN